MQTVSTPSMRMPYDTFRRHESAVYALYQAGKSIPYIADVTGVPKIRIQHEIEAACERKPRLLSGHLAAQYPSQRKAKPRFARAVLIIEWAELKSR